VRTAWASRHHNLYKCDANHDIVLVKGRRAILKRIGRLEHGLYGDCEPVGEGVLELRLFLGPGYRIYFGEDAGHIVILLCGGDRDTQTRDIKDAKEYWKEYKNHGKT